MVGKVGSHFQEVSLRSVGQRSPEDFEVSESESESGHCACYEWGVPLGVLSLLSEVPGIIFQSKIIDSKIQGMGDKAET